MLAAGDVGALELAGAFALGATLAGFAVVRIVRAVFSERRRDADRQK